MKKAIFLISISSSILFSNAQQDADGYPVIGKPCPDFLLENVEGYHNDKVSLADLQGQYVVLDFWHRHCPVCIASFPKMDQLAGKFEGKVKFFMVGLQDKMGLENLYYELKNRYNLTIPTAIDSSLYHRFVPGLAAPHIVLIDKTGTVKAVTSIVNEDMINAFISDEPFDFFDISYLAQIGKNRNYEYDSDRMFLKEGDQFKDYGIRYRSVFLDYSVNHMPKVRMYASVDDFVKSERKWLETSGSLEYFYKLAYFGIATWSNSHSAYVEYHREPILEIDDRSLFDVDVTKWTNMFWYRLYLPEERMKDPGFIMSVMQQDIFRLFGYRATVEVRNMPYWKVVATPEALEKLKSKGKETKRTNADDVNIYSLQDVPLRRALTFLFGKVYSKTYPIINETGFDDNIDMDFRDILRVDFEVIRNELERHGLFLEKGERPFKVLVIR